MKLLPLLGAAPAAAIVLSLSACVSTDVASQVAPDFVGTQFHRVLVVADVGMLYERTLAEDRIVDALLDRRINAVRSLDVVFAADTLPEEAFLNHAADAGADAVLLLRIVDEGSDARYVPPTQTSSFSANQFGGVVSGYSTTTTFGGRTVFKPWARFRATLIETGSGRTAWFADAETMGSSDSDSKDLVRNVSDEIAASLIADGLMESARRF